MRAFFLIVLLSGCFTNWGQTSEKMKGISFVASNTPISDKDVDPIKVLNANWVTLMPYGYIGKDGRIMFNTKWQWWGETDEGLEETIKLCKARGLKIMLKPQIWIPNGYTGNFNPETEEGWQKFEESYADFVLTFLKTAERNKVELFCIGTEWREFVKERTDFWSEFIDTVKNGFSGEITYAANWDDYQAVPFWEEMDYIGVNGYFPISYSIKPMLKELMAGWNVHKPILAKFSKRQNKSIIFTEIGYRSIDGATVKPWEHGNKATFNAQIQRDAFKALFTTLWNEDWFEGLFIWKWYHNHGSQGGNEDIDFTPQNKPAEKYIQQFWKEN